MSNLIFRIALIPSLLWLLLVGFVLWDSCKREGRRKALINLLGAFARSRFVECVHGNAGRPDIRFGYRLFGHRFYFWSLPVARIASVEWNAGQASGMAGKDMNDWSVAVWFYHDDPVERLKRAKYKHPDQDIYIVGPSRRKAVTASFGHKFVEFVRQAGSSLVPGEDECTFVSGATDTGVDGR